MRFAVATNTLLALSLLSLSACKTVGAKKMNTDRFSYGEAISDSMKSQTLLNIVRVRYSDWPMMLEVSQVVTSYTFENTASAKAIIKRPWGGDNDQGEAALVHKNSERPTVAFKPATGAGFVRLMLTPLHPAVLLSLSQSGWPIDRLFDVTVQGINGYSNHDMGWGHLQEADEGFTEALSLMTELKELGGLRVHLQAHGEKKAIATMIFREANLDDDGKKTVARLKTLLKLDPELNRYDVKWDVDGESKVGIAIQSRTVLQVMAALGRDVDIPQEDIDSGAVLPLQGGDVIEGERIPLLKVYSGATCPDKVFTAARYRDHWFWIADDDPNSKRTFAYLSMILTVTESDEKSGLQLVILTN